MAELEMPLKAASVAFDAMAAVARALAKIWSRRHDAAAAYGLASHALSMYLRKAPAAGGSHGSGTGVEFRPLVIGGWLFRYGGNPPGSSTSRLKKHPI
eukprot:scaffold18418_cov77-Skeletonema_dohrnii-CCMP3373.AAC.4